MTSLDGRRRMNLLFFGLVVSVVAGSGVHAQDPVTTPFPLALTSFTCHGRPPGYYADLETGCRTYHVCDGNSHFTYLCPKRTLFQQRSRICDHSYLVRCQDSPYFYETDDEEGTSIPPQESETNRAFLPENNSNQTEEPFPTTEPTTNEPIETPTTVPTTAETATVNTEEATVNLKGSQPIDSLEKFLKFRLKDFRSLFFIPEFDNNSVVVAKPERELILPVEETDLMTFRSRKEVSRLSSLCPAYCNPKFLVPGTCHPCIMIK